MNRAFRSTHCVRSGMISDKYIKEQILDKILTKIRETNKFNQIQIKSETPENFINLKNSNLAQIVLNLSLYPMGHTHQLWEQIDEYTSLAVEIYKMDPSQPRDLNFSLLSLIGLRIRSSYTMEDPYVQSDENKSIAAFEMKLMKTMENLK